MVHEMVANVPVKFIAVEAALLQTTWLTGILADGVGFTEIRNVNGVPEQAFAEGVTVTEALIGAFVLFVATKEGIFPDPLDARPIAVLLLAHVKVLPETGPVSDSNEVVSPLQNSSFTRLSTSGTGFTVTTTF